MHSMLQGRKKEAPTAFPLFIAAENTSANTADILANVVSPSTEVKEQWFTYLDNDGDGRLSQSDVFMGLCRLLRMEANPELVRPVRQLLTALPAVKNAKGVRARGTATDMSENCCIS